MKLTFVNISNRYVICLLSCVVFLFSCSKMNELSDRFLDQGEIIYAAKVDSAVAFAGAERVLVETKIGAQRIETVRIYWNNYADSADIHVGNKTGLFQKMLPTMPEAGYIFHLVSLDKFGNKSLPVEIDGTSYGDRFRSSLANRGITTAIIEGNKLTITWGGSMDKSIGCNVIYTNSSNQEVELFVLPLEASTIIPDWKSGLRYNTLFVPEASAIDTFSTAYEEPAELLNRVDRSTWTVTANSYEVRGQLPNGPPEKTLDGDPMTFWHSNHTGTSAEQGQADAGPNTPGYPHWLAYDMKRLVDVKYVELTSRNDGNENVNDFRRFTIQSSTDGINWTDVDTFTHPDTKAPQRYAPTTALKTRYIRIYMFEGPTVHCHLSEFSVFGN